MTTMHKILLTIFILFLSIPLFPADESAGTGITGADRFSNTSFKDLTCTGQSQKCEEQGEWLNNELREILPGISYLTRTGEEKARRHITGTFTFYDKKPGEPLKQFNIIVNIAELDTQKTTELKAAEDSRDKAVAAIRKKIDGYYKHLYENRLKTPQTGYGFSIAGSLLIPNYNFSQVAGIGPGLVVGFDFNNLFFKNSVFAIQSGFYWVSIKTESISLYLTSPHALFVGYSFSFDAIKDFSIIPMAGPGYMFHFIRGTSTSNELTTQADPSISFLCRFNYKLNENYSILCEPGFTIFFEQNLTSNYFTINLGIKYILTGESL